MSHLLQDVEETGSLCPERVKCLLWENKLLSNLHHFMNLGRPSPSLKTTPVEAFWSGGTSPFSCLQSKISAQGFHSIRGNLTLTRSSLLRRSITLMMKSLAIWKFCSPMLSELSNTNRRSTGPQVHSGARHRSRGTCFAGRHFQRKELMPAAALPSWVPHPPPKRSAKQCRNIAA